MLKQQFEQALSLFQQQQYLAAIALCESQLAHPMFKLLQASCYGKIAQFQQAECLFLELKSEYPSNLDVLFNFALVKKAQQQMAAAQELLNSVLTLNSKYHPAHQVMAEIYQISQRFPQAIMHYQQAIQLQPHNQHYVVGLAECYFETANYHAAFDCLNQSFSSGIDSAMLRLMAAILYKLKQVEPMRALMAQYPQQLAQEPQALLYAGLLELDEKCYVKALKILQQAQLASTVSTFEINANLAYCQYLLAPSSDLLLQILLLAESEGTESAYYFALNLLETLGQVAQAKQLMSQALEKFPESIQLIILQAKILTREKSWSAALAHLESLPQQSNPEDLLAIAYQKIAIFEAQGCYELAAAEIRALESNHPSGQPLTGLVADALKAMQDHRHFVANQHGHARPLVFIIGFPRSGTTLLESRLAPLKGVKILEETNAAKQFYAELAKKAAGQNVLAYLATLSTAERTHLAQDYLQRLCEYVDIEPDDIIVDKMPLNGLYVLPLLFLFPKAKVILMERHPMDLCLSSLKQRMINLFSVDAFAESYDCYFELISELKRSYARFFLTIKYEELVTNFQKVFNQVTHHAGIETNNGLAISGDEAPIMFNTPSYYQVSQPLYTKSVSAYRHYQAYINFNHPLLLQWCQRLDYSTD